MSLFTELTPSSPVLPVGELMRSARQLLERSFPLCWVSGEISNLTRAASGHWYFSLKDANAQVRCVMFRNKNLYLDWAPENGMQVEVRALATLYEARGEFQLNVESMRRAGLGALFEAFAKLKVKLEQEGVFDVTRKRSLPTHPRQIGIITSTAAAALKDVLSTLRRRMPSIPIIIYPTPVQGAVAGQGIAEALCTAGERAECDVLILCRGGGSIEDLWAFNEEIVARALHASPIPVVCGVGHETDFTIADFVADQRAPTPTAAAELTTPNRQDLLQRLGILNTRLHGTAQRTLEQRMQQIDFLSRRLVHPGEKLDHQLRHLAYLSGRLRHSCGRSLDNQTWHIQLLARRLANTRPDLTRSTALLAQLTHRMQLASEHHLTERSTQLDSLATHLEHLNPRSILARGFSIVESEDGELLRDSAQAKPGTRLNVTLARGWLLAEVTETDTEEVHDIRREH